MRKHSLLAAVGILAVGFAIKQDDPLAAVTVSRSYHSADFGSIDLLGVCSVTPDSAACWDADGKADSDLTTRITNFQVANPTSNLYFKYGHKNRLLVFRASTNVQGDYLFTNHPLTVDGKYPMEIGAMRGGGAQGRGFGTSPAWVDV